MNPPVKSHGTRVLRGLHALLGLALFFFVGECQAQVAPLTAHVREVTLSGQAPFVGNLPATQSMRLVLVLPLRNQAQLNEFLKNLYDPSSASFHQFLTVEEFTALFGPSEDDYNAVIQFAQANGFSVVGTSRNRLNVDVIGTVQTIDNAFHLQLGAYQHPTEDRTFYAPDREPTPSLSVQLWHIAGLDNYSIPHPAGLSRSLDVTSNATTGSGPAASFLGTDMRAAYYGGGLDGSGQSLGLVEYYGTDLSDLETYFATAGQTNNVPITLESTDGTPTGCLNSEGCDDTEQTLDMTQALGMAPGLSSLVVYIGSSDAAIFNAMATAAPLSNQLSSSWTWYPADPGTDDPYFLEFAAQGQNLFQAAGDGGRWTTGFADLSGGQCVCDIRRRYGLDDDRGGRRLELGKRLGFRRRRRFARPICDSRLADDCSPRLLQLLANVSQRPGCFGEREFYFLRLCRPNSLHCKRVWWDQFCGAHVGGLSGAGQSTGACQRPFAARFH